MQRAACPLRDVARLLAPAAGKIVLTRPWEVPELLWRTRIVAVGSFYQHGVAGFLRLRAAWRAPAGVEPSPAFGASGARFVLFCDTGRAHPIGFAGAPDSLWNRLAGGRPPPWLRLVGQEKAAGLRLYRMEDGGSVARAWPPISLGPHLSQPSPPQKGTERAFTAGATAAQRKRQP